jgi:hypothetical protein
LIFKTWDANRIFAVDLLLPKLAFISLKVGCLGGGLYKRGFFFEESSLKSMNARAVNYSENSSETM